MLGAEAPLAPGSEGVPLALDGEPVEGIDGMGEDEPDDEGIDGMELWLDWGAVPQAAKRLAKAPTNTSLVRAKGFITRPFTISNTVLVMVRPCSLAFNS